MTVLVEVRGKEACISLPPISDLPVAADLRQRLSEQIMRKRRIVIEADRLERISTPVIQVLLATGKTLAAQNQSLKIAGSCDVLRAGFADLGMAAVLESWVGPPR